MGSMQRLNKKKVINLIRHSFWTYALKDDVNENVINSIYDASRDGNALHIILREESMVSREKRNRLMQQYFYLCLVGNIRIENASVIKHSFFSFISPREQFTRYFSDTYVFDQFLTSGRRNKMYDHIGQSWHYDFFQSESYRTVLSTLPEDSDPVPPLLLEIYRLVIMMMSVWKNAII